jgi:hypothetical protein
MTSSCFRGSRKWALFELARVAYSESARWKAMFELARRLSFCSREDAPASSDLVVAATSETSSTQALGSTSWTSALGLHE